MLFKHSGYYFVILLLLTIVGFWESYFSTLFSESNTYVHFHAVTMLLWIGMLITQAFLIRFNKRSLHKIIGKSSFLLFPFIVLSLVLLAHSQIEIHNFGISYSRLYVLFLQLSLLVIFIIAYILAIAYRHSPAHHARYMICTSLTLIDPAIARIPLNIPPLPFSYQVLTFSLINIILILLIIFDSKKSKGREVFPLMLVVFMIFQGLNLTWTDSTTWDRFALWFAQLPLT